MEDEVTIGVAVLVAILAVVSLTACIRYMKRRRRTVSAAEESPGRNETQLYLQSKAELGTSYGRLEMDAINACFEIQGEGAATEMCSEGNPPSSFHVGGTHELRGEEHSKELEVP